MLFSSTPKPPKSDKTLLLEAIYSKDDETASVLAAKIEKPSTITFPFKTFLEDENVPLLEMVVMHGLTKTLLTLAARGAADLDVPSKLQPQYKCLSDFAIMQTNFPRPFIEAIFEVGGNPYSFEKYRDDAADHSPRWKWIKEVLGNAQPGYDIRYPEKAQQKKLEALINAIQRQDERGVDRIAARGVDVNVRLPKGELPLIHAIRTKPEGYGSADTRSFMDRSVYLADKLVHKLKADVNLAGNCGLPLQAAFIGARADMFEWLLKVGAKPDLPDSRNVTAAEMVFGSNRTTFVKALKDSGYDFDALLPCGDTPLLAALRSPVAKESNVMVETLVMLGVDVTKPDAKGRLPLEYAKKYSTPETLYTIQRACDAQSQRNLLERVAMLENQIAEMARLLTERTGEVLDKPIPPTAAPKHQP